jgi:hypothetical protein
VLAGVLLGKMTIDSVYGHEGEPSRTVPQLAVPIRPATQGLATAPKRTKLLFFWSLAPARVDPPRWL